MESEEKFLENKNRKWIFPVFGFIFSGLLTYYIAYGLYNLENSIYDRIRFDGLLETQFGDFGVRDALTEDIFLISYSYNFGIPRFYTKQYAIDPHMQMDYDVKMNFAAAATSATPFIFDPVTRYTFNNKQREEEFLIDGQVIANNPSLYAATYAKNKRNKEKLRLVSIGFNPDYDKGDLKSMSALDWINRLESIIVDAEVTTNSYMTEIVAEDYVRISC